MKLEVFFTAVTFAVHPDGRRETIQNDFVFKTSEHLGSLTGCQIEAQKLLKDTAKHLRRLLRDDTDSRKPNIFRDAKESFQRFKVRESLKLYR